MTTTILSIVGWAIILLMVPLIVLGTLTESHRQQARRLKQQGYSQLQIANLMGITRYKVRKLLA